MSERIRYKSISEDILESIQTFRHETNGGQYKVRMNLKEHKWYVLDAGTELVAVSGTNQKRAKAQLEVREALKQLGIPIARETRRERTKTV